MVYHKYGLKLSMPQIRKLANGDTIRINPNHHGGTQIAHLTKTQLKKLAKALAAKKGTNLKLSVAQLNHHRKIGKSGGNIFGSIGNFFKGAYEKVVKPAAKWVADHPEQALDYARKGLKLVTGIGISENAIGECAKCMKKRKRGTGVYAPGVHR